MPEEGIEPLWSRAPRDFEAKRAGQQEARLQKETARLKKPVGYHLDPRSTSGDWLAALNMAVNQRFPEGIKNRCPNGVYERAKLAKIS